MKRWIVVGLVALVASAAAAPARAAGPLALGSISMDVAPTSTISNWTLASSGTNTKAGGTLQVTANVAYTVSVTGDKNRLSEYDTTSNSYVTNGKTIGAALNVIAAKTSGTGTGATAVVGTNSTLATGLGTGTDAYSVTLSQATALTDSALATGHTYRIVLTYTASSTI